MYQAEASVNFPRTARLLTAADYGQVFKKNKRFADRYWTVLVRPGDEQPARLGMAMAKKRAKRAVDRNKLKRVVRECFRVQRHNLAGLDIVVMNRDAAASASKATLHQSIDSLLAKIAA